MQTITGVGGSLSRANPKAVANIQIPLPSLEAQKEIVAEIEGYQRVIHGARAVVENYQPHIAVDPEWPMVALGEICDVINGSTPSKTNSRYWDEKHVPWFTITDIRKIGRRITSTQQYVSHDALRDTSLRLLPAKSVLLCCTASVGEYAIAEIPLTTNQQFNGLVIKRPFVKQLEPDFLFVLASTFKDELIRLSGKTSFNFVSGKVLKKLTIPLPSLEVQQEIVAEIEGYQRVIDGNRRLIERFEGKIKAIIERVWRSKPAVELGAQAMDEALV